MQIERLENPEAGWFDPPSVWKVEFYDQGSNQRNKYVRCTPDKSEGHTLAVKNNQGEDLDIDHTFAIKDKYGSKTVVKGTVVDANVTASSSRWTACTARCSSATSSRTC